MKRDMDLIRKIAFALEESGPTESTDIVVDGYSDELIAYNCELMLDAGLIVVRDAEKIHSFYLSRGTTRLSWSGHEFLDAARNDTVWNSVTGKVKSTATTMTFDGLKSLLQQAGQQALKHGADWLLKTDWQWVQYFPLS